MRQIKLSIILICFSLISLQEIKAQVDYHHTMGLALNYYSYDGRPNVSGSAGLMYAPRFNYLELGKEVGFSVRFPLSGGVYYDAGENLSYFADGGGLLEFNFGYGATMDGQAELGVGLGAGIHYHHFFAPAPSGVGGFGPMFNFEFRWDTGFLEAVDVMAAPHGKQWIFGLRLLWVLNDYGYF